MVVVVVVVVASWYVGGGGLFGGVTVSSVVEEVGEELREGTWLASGVESGDVEAISAAAAASDADEVRRGERRRKGMMLKLGRR